MLSGSVSQGGFHEAKLEGGADLRAAGFIALLLLSRPIFQPAPVEERQWSIGDADAAGKDCTTHIGVREVPAGKQSGNLSVEAHMAVC